MGPYINPGKTWMGPYVHPGKNGMGLCPWGPFVLQSMHRSAKFQTPPNAVDLL